MSDIFSLTLPIEAQVKNYLTKNYDYLSDTDNIPIVNYGYLYRPGIFIATRGAMEDTGFDLFGLVYMPTKRIADKASFTIKAARLLQKHIQFDLPISFATYLKLLKYFDSEKLKLFHELPAISLLSKL